MGSVVLPHLVTGWHVDQAIMTEEERLVVIRFGRDWDPDCMRQDEVLYRKMTLVPLNPQPLMHPLRYCRPCQKLRRNLCLRSRPSSRLQANVRALGSHDSDVLLPQQTHDVRFRYGKQQQAELGAGG